MRQVNIFCEGPTEQGFCALVLQPHLFSQGNGIIHTLSVGEKDHHHVYGLGRGNKYAKVKKFILNILKQRQGKNVFFTTFFDLYALPHDFPGKAQNARNPDNPILYVHALEKAFNEDIGHFQFISHLQLHEYETMLFADPEKFKGSFENCDEGIQKLKLIAASMQSIEHINDGANSAPSKRIRDVIPEYEGRKSTAGPDIAKSIGIAHIRAKCAHFHEWISLLENLKWEEE